MLKEDQLSWFIILIQILTKKPKLVHHKFLNNIEYENSNFIHPNIFIQNGINIYYIIFDNCETTETITAKLIKFNIITGAEETFEN